MALTREVGRDVRVVRARARAAAVRQGWHKLRWGARTVGAVPALAGGLRLWLLRVRSPERGEVRLRSGAVMEFDVPAQVPAALVVFRDLIDPEFAFLRQVAEPSWVVVDVGSAIGQFSVFAAALPVAEVHAFEPSSANRATMARNLARNGLADRVRIHRTALSDHTGEATFETAGNAYLSRLDRHPAAGVGQETVPVATLADEVARLGLGRISVLKVNVAGYEPEVLAGAAPLLREGAIDILVLLIGTRSVPSYVECRRWGYEFFFFHPGDRVLHRIRTLDEDTVQRPPWPARHVIAVHRAAPRTPAWDALAGR